MVIGKYRSIMFRQHKIIEQVYVLRTTSLKRWPLQDSILFTLSLLAVHVSPGPVEHKACRSTLYHFTC